MWWSAARRKPERQEAEPCTLRLDEREVWGLHAQCFQLAFDTAKKAERALQHELGDGSPGFLKFGY